ncbi:MAG: peptidoglycan-associated lipoprotein Pal [Stellaceae bacterium]
MLAAAVLALAACKQAPETATNTSGATNTAATAPATPSGPVKGSEEDFKQNVGDRVFFDLNKSSIKPEGQQTLERQAAWLKQYPNVTVQVEGHCDDRGTREYNLALGNRRAVAAKNALVALGVPAARIKTISYGKDRPIVVGDNEAAWAQNRVAITVVE